MKKLNSHIRNQFRFLIAAVLIFCGTSSVFAKPEIAKKVSIDSSVITVKRPSESSQNKYYGDDYWKYQKDSAAAKKEPDAFDRLWKNFWKKFFGSVSTPKGNSVNPWSILIIIVFVTLLVLGILQLTNSGVRGIFSGKKHGKEKTDAMLEDIDIHSIDYEEEIRRATSRKDFRLAVRLWFLRTLKSFSDKELLHWKMDKTNSDYYYELIGTNYQQEFGDVSKVYDYIWYGEFPVDENSYKKAEEQFRGLNKKLE